MKRKLLIMAGICMVTLAGCQGKQTGDVQETLAVSTDEKETESTGAEVVSTEEIGDHAASGRVCGGGK